MTGTKVYLKKLLVENKNYKTLSLLENIEAKHPSSVVKKTKRQIFEEVVRNLVREASLSDIKTRLVGDQEGQVSSNVFQSIVDVSKDDRDKLNNTYVEWLATNVGKGYIKDFDVEQFGSYLKAFSRFKGSFPSPDIMSYNAPDKISKFAEIAKDKLETRLSGDSKYIDRDGISRLDKVGIDFLGMTENGYQVFKVDKDKTANDRELAQKTFRNVLGRCKGQAEGEKISQCIFAAVNHFNTYLAKDDIYVFYNLSDTLSPYSFVYGSNEFKDKNNNTIEITPEDSVK